MDKPQLLERIHAEYATFTELLDNVSEEQMTMPGVNGDWSIKDILAHIAAWQHRLDERLEAALEKREPTLSTNLTNEQMDIDNQRFYEEYKARPLKLVLEDFRAIYGKIVATVHELDTEDLLEPDRFPWMQGNPLWQLIAGDTYEHYEEHAEPIRAWLEKQR